MSFQEDTGTNTSTVRIEPAARIIETKQIAGTLHDQHIEVLVMGYADRILITITSEGKIGQLVVPPYSPR